jgi:hypothetical protein
VTDAELRALVRQAVARHLGGAAPSPADQPRPTPVRQTSCAEHPSHHQYVTLVNVGDACVIEPSVACDHCGYCRSHGH